MRRRPSLICAAGVTLSLVLAGCSGGEDGATEDGAVFALTNSVSTPPQDDEAYAANLMFVADPADPVWDQLTEVAVPGGPTLGAGEFFVHPGPEMDQGMFGNLAFDITADMGEISFDTVELSYEDGESRVVPVGDWTVEADPSDGAVQQTGEPEPTTEGCGPLRTTVQNTTEGPVTPGPVEVSTPGVVVTGATVGEADQIAPQEEVDVAIALQCDESADFYIVSPDLRFTAEDGTEHRLRLEPVAIGFEAINETTVERILERRG